MPPNTPPTTLGQDSKLHLRPARSLYALYTIILIWHLFHSEAWRYTGPFTRMNRFRGLFPGFGIAATAFAGYLVYEQLFLTSSHGHGKEGHGEEGHGDGHH